MFEGTRRGHRREWPDRIIFGAAEDL